MSFYRKALHFNLPTRRGLVIITRYMENRCWSIVWLMPKKEVNPAFV
ncbi:hypothetical protein [Acetobacterium bakii]|nr:hypothetical protein [Acetobacterium bakii]